MAKYSYQQNGDVFTFYEGSKVLKTPGGNDVTTHYKLLADRILADLNRLGMSFRSIDSILAWHFTTIDNFAPMGHKRVERELIRSFLMTPDWTCRERHGSEWLKAFGKWDTRALSIKEWFSKASIMQLTAACCIGNAYEGVNIAFAAAVIMEKFTGEERKTALEDLAELISDNTYYGPKEDIVKDFETFELYYGIDLDRNGPILEDIIAGEPDYSDEEEIDVDELSGRKVTIDQLVGRNYYHYTDAEQDPQQPDAISVKDLNLSDSDDEEDEEEPEDEEEDDSEGLSEYLPDSCWVKRFVDSYDPNTYYLLYLVVGKEGTIEDSGCIEETATPMGGG